MITKKRAKNPLDLALFTAIQNVDLETTIYLIKQGARVNVFDHFDRSPLHAAIKTGNVEIVNLILHGTIQENLDHKDLNGRTPLHYAACAGNFEMICLLLNAGCNYITQDDEHKSPLEISATFGINLFDIIRQLSSQESDDDKSIDNEDEADEDIDDENIDDENLAGSNIYGSIVLFDEPSITYSLWETYS